MNSKLKYKLFGWFWGCMMLLIIWVGSYLMHALNINPQSWYWFPSAITGATLILFCLIKSVTNFVDSDL